MFCFLQVFFLLSITKLLKCGVLPRRSELADLHPKTCLIMIAIALGNIRSNHEFCQAIERTDIPVLEPAK